MQKKPVDIVDYVADGVYFLDTNRRILRWNKAAERLTGFSAGEVCGRSCADNILAHVDDQGHPLCRGHCPVAQTLKDGQRREAQVNLHHKDGHRVPVKVAVCPVHNEQGEIIGAVETFQECAGVVAMRSTIERLKQWGCVDIQSALPNRRIAEAHLEQRMQEMQRFGWPFAILLAEIDFLPQLRERWGEEGAAMALRMAAMGVQNSLRSLDMVARWDDVTIIAIIANAKIDELKIIAERVRVMVDSSYRQRGEGELHATVSVGAVAVAADDSVAGAVAKAQRCVYQSRSAGRNRACVFGVGELPRMDSAQ